MFWFTSGSRLSIEEQRTLGQRDLWLTVKFDGHMVQMRFEPVVFQRAVEEWQERMAEREVSHA